MKNRYIELKKLRTKAFGRKQSRFYSPYWSDLVRINQDIRDLTKLGLHKEATPLMVLGIIGRANVIYTNLLGVLKLPPKLLFSEKLSQQFISQI